MIKIPASSLTDEDMLFLDQAATLFPCDLPFLVLSGSNTEINAVINRYAGTPAVNPRYDRISHYNGPLLQPVAITCKAFADRMALQPMTMMDRMYAVRGLNRQAFYPKLYAQYFARGPSVAPVAPQGPQITRRRG